MSDYSAKEIDKVFKQFIDSRYVRIDGKKYLPVEEDTPHQFMMELVASRLEKEDDDWRSRA